MKANPENRLASVELHVAKPRHGPDSLRIDYLPATSEKQNVETTVRQDATASIGGNLTDPKAFHKRGEIWRWTDLTIH
jgi:hypothetical protein